MQAVRAAIKPIFPVDLPTRAVRKCLVCRGFTPQQPVRRACEQRVEAVEKWLRDEFPAIVKRAQAEGFETLWAGETTAGSVDHYYPQGYAPCGKMPVLLQSGRSRGSLVSAIAKPGQVTFHALP